METKLRLVRDQAEHAARDERLELDDASVAPHFVPPHRGSRHHRSCRHRGGGARVRILQQIKARAHEEDGELGAVTAEYAIVIMAAVAFAGLLVAIMRSAEIRAMLVKLVEDALGAAG